MDAFMLAEKVVDALFVNGQGLVADRLVLAKDGKDLGGWGRDAAVARLSRVIEEFFAPPPCKHRFMRMMFSAEAAEAHFQCADCCEVLPGTCTVEPNGSGGFHVIGRLEDPE